MKQISNFLFLLFSSVVIIVSCDSGTGMSETADWSEEEKKVLGISEDANNLWRVKFPQFYSLDYEPVTIRFYEDSLESACGQDKIAMDNFYCGSEKAIYMSTGYIELLKQKHPQLADDAVQIILAHLFAHHIQNMNNLAEKIAQMQTGTSALESEKLMVRMELQTEFLAGVQIHHLNSDSTIEMEEIAPVLEAIYQLEQEISSDGSKLVHSFSSISQHHRGRWFRRGFYQGDLTGGDTFSIPFQSL